MNTALGTAMSAL